MDRIFEYFLDLYNPGKKTDCILFLKKSVQLLFSLGYTDSGIIRIYEPFVFSTRPHWIAMSIKNYLKTLKFVILQYLALNKS